MPSRPRRPAAVAVVVGAGRGKRSGLPVNKAFFRHRGLFLVERTLRSLCACPGIGAVVVVLNRRDLRDHGPFLRRKFPKVRAAVEGGRERRDSVLNGLAAAGRISAEAVVLIHDAARPFVSARIVRDCLSRTGPRRGAVPVLPVANTLKKIERDAVLKTVDRTGLVEVQTPQAFLLEDILEAYRRHGPGQATDDCRIFESAGWKVVTVPGSVFNFKVTWPEDILLFRILEEAHVQDRLRR